MSYQSDPGFLARQYADDTNLAARRSIYSYQQPRVVLPEWVLDLVQPTGAEAVLDVGCGNGVYGSTLRARGHRGPIVSVDQSIGMLREVGAGARARADAQRLPFPDDAFDLVLAMHMLYHVGDRSHAIDELRRVARPSGAVLVLTNSEQHLQEFDDWFGYPGVSFTVENGRPELERSFSSVELHETRGELVLDDVAPLRTYASSAPRELDIERGIARAAALLERDGVVRITTACGLFVCRD